MLAAPMSMRTPRNSIVFGQIEEDVSLLSWPRTHPAMQLASPVPECLIQTRRIFARSGFALFIWQGGITCLSVGRTNALECKLIRVNLQKKKVTDAIVRLKSLCLRVMNSLALDQVY